MFFAGRYIAGRMMYKWKIVIDWNKCGKVLSREFREDWNMIKNGWKSLHKTQDSRLYNTVGRIRKENYFSN